LRSELEFVGFHVHPTPPKAHSLRFQPQPLFDGRIATQFDLAACSEDALPRQAECPVQHSRDLTRAAWDSRRASDGAVGRDLSRGDFLDGCADARLRGYFQCGVPFFRPFRARRVRAGNPGLTPRAAFFRRFAAGPVSASNQAQLRRRPLCGTTPRLLLRCCKPRTP
jgi:hypothetical protein